MSSSAACAGKPLREAMAAFRLGRRCYEAHQFALARRYADEYRQKVDYEAFPLEDRRPMVDGQPAWSIIIVGYNTGPDLLDCLNSVFKQNQSNYEVILVDNGKNEAIRPQLQEYPLLHVAPPENMLPSEGRNIGAYFARGEYLAFVDDDGLVTDNYLEEGQKALTQPNVIGARGRIVPKSKGGGSNTHYDMGPEPKSALLTLEGNMVIHRAQYRSIGGFDPLMFGHEGKELGIRLKKAYNGSRTLYWPALELKHDFAETTRLEAKRKRQEAGANYIKLLTSKVEDKPPMEQMNYEQEAVDAAGVSIIVRAGNNEQAARKFLEQFIALNTFKPVEVFVLFSKPAEEHLRLMTEFAAKVRIAILHSSEKSLAEVARNVRHNTLLLVSTPAEVKNDCLADLWKLLNRNNDALLNVPASNLSNSAIVTKEAALTLDTTPVYATAEEIELALDGSANGRSTKSEGLTHWQVQHEGVPLDTQIEVLEAELEKRDKQLSALYAEIETLDKQYDALPASAPEAEQLKEKLKAMVEDSNDRLKNLKAMHDQLEHLRIRKYSISA